MKVLILASNPRQDLDLGNEIRALRKVIDNSYNQQKLEIVDALAVQVGDLHELFFRHRPQIVHFCGHGMGQQGLVFEGNDDGEQWVRTEALSDLFRLFASDIDCVLLNACYSEEQANAIVGHIDYVVGMNQEIRDDAAIAFSTGFYRALGYNCPVQQAYEFGKNAIQLEISGSSKTRSVATETTRKAEVVGAIQHTVIPEHLKPILKIRPTLAQSSRPNTTNTTAPEQLLLEIDQSLEAKASQQPSVVGQQPSRGNASVSSGLPGTPGNASRPLNQVTARATGQTSRKFILLITILLLGVGLMSTLLGVQLYSRNQEPGEGESRNVEVTPANSPSDTQTTEANTEITQQVLDLINVSRVSHGLKKLQWNNQLATAAQVHSQSMALGDFFTHQELKQRIKAAGYQYSSIGENIAGGQSTSEQALTIWMNSPGHRKNILNPNYTEIGIGYFYLEDDPGEVKFKHYWTIVFGKQ